MTAREQVDVRLYEAGAGGARQPGRFPRRNLPRSAQSRNVIVATGFFDLPNRLGVPGEELPKLTHYYREPYPYVQQRVIVIGAKNSAAKAALDCYRHGAEVTMVVRGPSLSETVKYWIRPDLENRIKEGSIRAYFDSTVEEIRDGVVLVRTPGGTIAVPNDFVLAMTGYRPDFPFLETLGITFARRRVPDPDLRRDDVRECAPRPLPGGHRLRRTEDQPVVHRERPVPCAADRDASRRAAHRGDPVRVDSLENGRVTPATNAGR